MARIIVLVLIFATGALATSACVDPGCIRNSECGPNYDCKNARCIPSGDSGVGTVTAGTAAVVKPTQDSGTQTGAVDSGTPVDSGK